MIVFEWFYDKAKLIEEKLKKEKGYKVSMTFCYSHTHVYTIYSH